MPQAAPSRAPISDSPYTVVFNPELDLILACCGEDSSGERSSRIQKILRHGINWARLIQLAERHGVVPVVYRRLSAAVGVSETGLLEPLRQLEKLNAHRSLWLTLELLNIHRHLAARGLEVLPYKGPVSAEILYGNVAMRQFSDLDLLIRSRDLPAIKSALAELGYHPALHLTPPAERAYLKSGYEYTFDGAHGRNLIEIKWQVLPRHYSIDFDVSAFFDRAVQITVEGQRLRTLCDQDLVLVLCVHAAKHAWMQISNLCDIALLARSQGLDWTALNREAARLGIARIVAVTFALAQELLGETPPVEINLAGDSCIEPLAHRILQSIVSDAEFDPESIPYFRLMADLRERRRDRMSFLWRLAFTPGPGEWSAIRLPGPLFPLYRGVRMYRLAGRLASSRW